MAERCRFCGKSLPSEEAEGLASKVKKPGPVAGKGRNLWKVAIFLVLGGFLLFRLVTVVMSGSHVFTKGSSPAKSVLDKSVSLPADAAAKPAETTPEAMPPADEPNFISVNGKVIPNPKKTVSQSVQPGYSAAPLKPAGEEPNFISVNGKVIPNPKKQRNSTVAP